jgi:hypothetical protein
MEQNQHVREHVPCTCVSASVALACTVFDKRQVNCLLDAKREKLCRKASSAHLIFQRVDCFLAQLHFFAGEI